MLKSLSENLLLKILSLVFALVLWLFVMGEQKSEVAFSVALELKNVPEGLMVVSEVPDNVDVRISGPRTLVRNLRTSDVSIAVDLKNLEPGVTSFKRLDERLNLPSGIRVTRLSPASVDLRLEPMQEKTVPVQPILSGTPAPGFRIAGVRAEPPEVELQGAESELAGIEQVPTEPVPLEGVEESFSRMVPLDYAGQYSSLKEHEAVQVEVDLERVTESHEPLEKTGSGK